jgi:hypothetical protein
MSWYVYHSSLDNDYEIYLNLDNASTSGATMATPSSTVINYNNLDPLNKVAYCFYSVEGYSKFGSYIGNQDADGTFVYTGFRPALVIAKNATATENWTIQDSARSPYNAVDIFSRPDGNNVENNDSGTPWIDFLSNGFKIRSADTKINDSGETFIYLAFAETPFKYSNAR